MKRVLVIDNYDSFTYNLVHGLKAQVDVVRNDAIDRAGVEVKEPDGVILSPGPGHPSVPRDVGVCASLLEDPLSVPMLGVCLGMQAMAHYTGAQVVPAPEVVHGRSTRIDVPDHPLFAGVPRSTDVGRYHSFCVASESLGSVWEHLASTDDGTLMAMAHRQRPWIGVQFHPESILTPEGPRMLANFLEMC